MYVIAEIGINHNGDLQTALDLIKIAKEAGCQCVKFQKRNPDVCVPEEQKSKPRTFKGEEMTYLEYKKRIEFGEEEYDIINKYCNDLNIYWTVSVWDKDSVEFMKRYKDNIPFIKIPSACITDMELLDAVNDLDVPVVMSNGMSTQEEVDEAVAKLEKLYAILHCNSSYPSNENEIDLNVMSYYMYRYPGIFIGYSGHEIGSYPTELAHALGANIIERHITLDKNMEGSDHKASLEPDELKDLIQKLKRIDKIKGEVNLTIYPEEEKVRQKLRK